MFTEQSGGKLKSMMTAFRRTAFRDSLKWRVDERLVERVDRERASNCPEGQFGCDIMTYVISKTQSRLMVVGCR